MKNSWVAATSWYHCVAGDSTVAKTPVVYPLQALVHPQTQKNYPAWIVNPQSQLLRNCLFWLKKICRLGIVDFNIPSNWRVSQLQKSKFAVLVSGFEKVGVGTWQLWADNQKHLLSHLLSMVAGSPPRHRVLPGCWRQSLETRTVHTTREIWFWHDCFDFLLRWANPSVAVVMVLSSATLFP